MQYKNFNLIHTFQSTDRQSIEVFNNYHTNNKYLYLIAGVHGDEHEGVYALSKLISWLDAIDIKLPPLIIIPIVNPDGFLHKKRTNSNGVDLNRNLSSDSWSSKYEEAQYNPGVAPLSEVENQGLVEMFNRYAPGFIFSFHSWKPMVNYNGDCKEIADFLTVFNKYEVVADIGYPTPGSLGAFGPEKYNCPVITYECPRIEVDIVWQEVSVGLKDFFHHWQKLLPKNIN